MPYVVRAMTKPLYLTEARTWANGMANARRFEDALQANAAVSTMVYDEWCPPKVMRVASTMPDKARAGLTYSYDERKAMGLCVQCCRPSDGKSYCASCAAEEAARMRAHRHRARQAARSMLPTYAAPAPTPGQKVDGGGV